MTWKKTWFSYFVWGVSTVLLILAYFWLGMDIVKSYEAPVWFLGIPLILVLICFFGVKLFKNKMVPLQISNTFWITMEALCFTLLFAGGFLARLYTATDISDTEMFRLCSISLQTSELQNVGNALLELYVAFIKNAFYFVGNSWIVAVAVQMNLQLISFVLFYVVVRKLSGAISALISFAFVLFSPMCITASVTLDPAVFYFALCVLALYFVTEAVCRFVANRKVKAYQYIFVVVIGLLTGAIVYLDIAGVWVVVAALTLLGLSDFKDQNKIKGKTAYFILYMIFVLVGILVMLFVSCGFKPDALKDVFLAWEANFVPMLGQSLYLPLGITFGMREVVYVSLLFFACLLGVLGFWESKVQNPQLGAFVSTLLIMALGYNCPAAEVSDRKILFIAMLAFLAGAGMKSLIIKDKLQAVTVEPKGEPETMYEEAKEEIVAETLEETSDEVMAEIAEETAVGVREEVYDEIHEEIREEIHEESQTEPVVDIVEKPEIQFIPNPLPLPKKHVKKTMNYGIDVEDEMMDFDIEIAEDDDFDI